jgi:hypothetical protein
MLGVMAGLPEGHDLLVLSVLLGELERFYLFALSRHEL